MSYFKLLLTAWFLMFIISDGPGRIEASTFPVIENVKIEKYASRIESKSDVFIEFEKMRGDCSFVDINFYLRNSQGNTTLLIKELDGEASVRGAGKHRSGPWRLNVSDFRIEELQVEIIHDCHPVWMTISNFVYVVDKNETRSVF